MGVSETIEVVVEYYNILCNLDETQWTKLFTESEISGIIDKALTTGDQPPLIRNAAVKLFGSVIYIPSFQNNPEFINKSTTFIFNSASDSSVGVTMKVAWSVSNYCRVWKSFTDDH